MRTSACNDTDMAKDDNNEQRLNISAGITVEIAEIDFDAIRAQGSGGQNVNKVSSAMHLRFNVKQSSLREDVKEKILAYKDQRISNDGVIIIKAQKFRSQDKNRADALGRLKDLIAVATTEQKKRKPTRPTRGSQKRRVDSKSKRGKVKSLRKKIDY